MAFAENQMKLLEGKLPEKHVKTRVQRGMTLSYIEGWHAITEANRIFGFDGWDREMVQAECVWQDGRGATKLCAYTARVKSAFGLAGRSSNATAAGSGRGAAQPWGSARECAQGSRDRCDQAGADHLRQSVRARALRSRAGRRPKGASAART